MSEPTLALAVAFLPALLDSRPLAVGCTHTLINATIMQTSGQRIPTKGRIAPALVTPAAGESILKPRIGRDAAVHCGQVCGPVLTRGLLRTRYKMEEQPPKLPLRLGIRGPHLIHGSLGPQPKRRLDRFSRFCRAHYCDQQTHTHTHTHTLQWRRPWVTVLGKLLIPIVPLFTNSEIGSSPFKGCDGNCGPGGK